MLTGSIVCEIDFEVPESCEAAPSNIYTIIPINITYTLDEYADYIKVSAEVVNNAKDYWLRANFPTDIKTEFSVTNSHFDVLKHDIAIPDSLGWVEQAFGMQPLRAFAEVIDGENGFAVMPKELYEYEVYDDSVMALTLIRACRIKLAVSEEKVTELEDEGIQCPGKHIFEYAMHFNTGDYDELPNKASKIFTPVKCAVCGRGKGNLPLGDSMLEIDNTHIHVTAIKRAEDGNGTIVRYYNPKNEPQSVTIKTKGSLYICRMDESIIEEISNTYLAPAKKDSYSENCQMTEIEKSEFLKTAVTEKVSLVFVL